MRITRREAEDALALPKVQAFLRVIRHGESDETDDERAYRLRYHPTRITYFDDLSQHPRIFETTPDGRRSSAAGAYQITATTYDDFAPRLGITDFTPRSQDIIAVAIMAAEGALAHLLAGRFDDAMFALRGRWTSLPGAEESSVSWTMAKAREVYDKWLRKYDTMTQPAAPIEERGVPAQPQEEAPMAPALMFLPAILEMIPSLVGLFGKPELAARNQKAAQIAVDTFTKAVPGAINTQQAVEMAQSDPAVRAAAAQAVLSHPVIESMLSIGPTGIKEAREANVAAMSAADRWWKLVLNPVLLVTLMVLPLVYMIVWALMPFLSKVSSDVIAQTIGTVVGLALGGIMGFWMGQTYQQTNRRSTDTQGGIGAASRAGEQ